MALVGEEDVARIAREVESCAPRTPGAFDGAPAVRRHPGHPGARARAARPRSCRLSRRLPGPDPRTRPRALSEGRGPRPRHPRGDRERRRRDRDRARESCRGSITRSTSAASWRAPRRACGPARRTCRTALRSRLRPKKRTRAAAAAAQPEPPPDAGRRLPGASMSAKTLAVAAVVVAAGAIVGSEDDAAASGEAAVAARERQCPSVVLVADPREADTECGCGQIIRRVREAKARGVDVEELGPADPGAGPLRRDGRPHRPRPGRRRPCGRASRRRVERDARRDLRGSHRARGSEAVTALVESLRVGRVVGRPRRRAARARRRRRGGAEPLLLPALSCRGRHLLRGALRRASSSGLRSSSAFVAGVATATTLLGVAAAIAGRALSGLGGWAPYAIAVVPIVMGLAPSRMAQDSRFRRSPGPSAPAGSSARSRLGCSSRS